MSDHLTPRPEARGTATLFAGRILIRLALGAAAVVGGLLGALFYFEPNIGRLLLYTTAGALVAVSAATVVILISARSMSVRRVALTEVRVYVPQVSELTFAVSKDARETAWEMFIELSTRISTQPLANDQGFVREALNSLYYLFGRFRELLAKSHPTKAPEGDKTVEFLALTMLNTHLRPFLAKWHPRLTRFEQSGNDEATWSDNEVFRDELEQVRQHLVEFTYSFARLAGVTDPGSVIEPPPAGLE